LIQCSLALLDRICLALLAWVLVLVLVLALSALDWPFAGILALWKSRHQLLPVLLLTPLFSSSPVFGGSIYGQYKETRLQDG
jgi:hypothetical protein